MVGFYFKKYLGFAVGINVTGAGLGMFASGPLIQYFLNTFGVHGTFLLKAAVLVQVIVFGALMRPSNLEISTKVNNKHKHDGVFTFSKKCINYFSIFSNKTFSIVLFIFILWNIAYGIVLLHLPNYAITKGASSDAAAMLITMVGLGSTINRVITGLTQGPGGIDPVLLFMGFNGVAGAVTMAFPLFSDNYAGQIVYALLFGIYTGGVMVLVNPLAIDLVGLEKLSSAVGLIFLMCGIGNIIGPPIAGMYLK